MKPKNLLLPSAVFAAGFALAWIVVPMVRSAPPDSDEADGPSNIATKSGLRPRDGRESSRIRNMVDDLLAKASADPYGERETGDIAEEDYPALLADLILRAEASGWSTDQTNLMNSLIWNWHEANPDAALSWVLEMENHNIGNRLLGTILGKVTQEDPAAAIALAELHGVAAGRHLKMPYAMIEHLAGADAETFVRAMACFNTRSGSQQGDIDFTEGFDFRHALDRLTEISAGLEDGTRVSVMPSNLLSEWAKRDWNGAWEWALSEEKSPFKDLGDLVNRAATQASADELAGYAATLASLPNRSPEQNFRDAATILRHRTSPELVDGFLSQLPGDRQENLNGILSQSFDGTGNVTDMLLARMTPAERIAAFQDDAVRQRLALRRDVSSAQLRQLGHSDEEIQRMLPPETGREPDDSR